ncbi:MAG: diacylglycerol kinase family lipid kinase [Candidatus Woesearchaeota archaeon]
MDALIISNPSSGRGAAGKKLPKIQNMLEKEGIHVEVYTTRKKGDAIRKAKKASSSGAYDMMIASGGDGTINEVINGIAASGNTEIKFGVIPMGTENVLAHEMGIPLNLVKAAKIIIGGNTRKIDLGLANKRYFVLMAGIGFDAHVASRVEPLLKRLIGSAAYPITAWNELFRYDHSKISVRVDKKRSVKGCFVVVGNTKLYGARLRMAPDADISDGRLDVCIFKGDNILSFLRYALGMITSRHINFSDIEYIQAREISITAEPAALCHVDCEVIGTTPVNIRVVPKAVKMIVNQKEKTKGG